MNSISSVARPMSLARKAPTAIAEAAEWVKDHPSGTVRALGIGVLGASPVLGPLAHLVTAFPTQCAGFEWPGTTTWGTIGTGLAGIATNLAGYAGLGAGHPVLGAVSLAASGALLIRNNYVANNFTLPD